MSFSGQDQDADVPVGDVTEHAGDGPVLVHGSGERLVVEPFDERAQTLALAGIRFDVGAVVSHWPILAGMARRRPYTEVKNVFVDLT